MGIQVHRACTRLPQECLEQLHYPSDVAGKVFKENSATSPSFSLSFSHTKLLHPIPAAHHPHALFIDSRCPATNIRALIPCHRHRRKTRYAKDQNAQHASTSFISRFALSSSCSGDHLEHTSDHITCSSHKQGRYTLSVPRSVRWLYKHAQQLWLRYQWIEQRQRQFSLLLSEHGQIELQRVSWHPFPSGLNGARERRVQDRN